MNEMTLNEFKEVFTYLLDNNKRLEDQGQRPIAIGVEGPPGIGKTSLIENIAQEKGMTMCKILLSQVEEQGDITGLPIKEFEAQYIEDNEVKNIIWILEKQIKYLEDSYKLTGKVRMSYAPPAWLPEKENPNGIILLLDDFTRANSILMNSIMEIINTCSYVSWKLPKYTSIILSSNPDNGEFSVVSLDDAQKNRYINFNLKMDVKEWAQWAENNEIESKAINFALMYGEEIFKKHNNVQIVTPRSYTTFCKAISGIKDWSKPDNLALILQISKGCFMNDTDNIIGNLFTTFIANKLDKLVSPDDMLKLKWDTLAPKMKACVYDEERFKPEVASVLTLRFMNYVLYQFGIKGAIKDNIVHDRILEIIESKDVIFTEDLLFHLIKTLVTKYPGRTGKLLMNAKIRNKIIL